MPKLTPYPRLRTHVRKGKSGQRWVSYWFDGRPDGESDTSLGNDYTLALEKWAELFHHKPRISGTLEEAFGAWEKEVLPTYTSDETRKGYARNLKELRRVFSTATWDQIMFPTLKQYLKKRTAKTQGNREMAVLRLVWNWARGEGLTALHWPAAGMERSRWMNKETPRQFEVTDALFAAIYTHATKALRDCMDLASATGLRLTDCRTVQMPPGVILRVKASKTGKVAEFSAASSPVLSRLLAARKALSVSTLMILVTDTGKPVSARMLRDYWDEARSKAAANPENAAIKEQIQAMYLRDMRSRASDLAGSLEEASELLQHGDKATTAKHYRTKVQKLRPVR